MLCGSFEHPRQMLKLMDKKVITIILPKILFILENYFLYFSSKTYAVTVGTQKNRLNETVLLSTQNIC